MIRNLELDVTQQILSSGKKLHSHDFRAKCNGQWNECASHKRPCGLQLLG